MEVQSDIYEFYKENPENKIWKVTHYRLYDKEKGIVDGNFDVIIGEVLFSFDKKKIYNLWTDYPQNFTKEEKERRETILQNEKRNSEINQKM